MKFLFQFLLIFNVYALDIIQSGLEVKKGIIGGEFGTFGILQHAPNNGFLYFKVKNSSVACKPYGIVSVHEILYDTNASKRCRETILNYFHKNPKDYYFSDYHLHLQQMYHLEYKPDACVVYSNGSVSYARELLQNGLAKVKKGFKDPLFRKKYKAEEQGAKFLKRGMYKSTVLRDCMGEFRK